MLTNTFSCSSSRMNSEWNSKALFLLLYSRIQNAIAPVRSIPSTRAPSQIIRQHLFLPQPGDSSTDPIGSDDTGVTDHYNAPVLKQLIPTRKNNHISGNQNRTDKREYIDIPLPKSILQINLQNHDAKCARYNDYIMPPKSNVVKHYNKSHHHQPTSSNECSCKTSSTDVDKHDISSNNRLKII